MCCSVRSFVCVTTARIGVGGVVGVIGTPGSGYLGICFVAEERGGQGYVGIRIWLESGLLPQQYLEPLVMTCLPR